MISSNNIFIYLNINGRQNQLNRRGMGDLCVSVCVNIGVRRVEGGNQKIKHKMLIKGWVDVAMWDLFKCNKII